MSWTREVTIWCDRCSHWEQSTATVAEARRELRRKGWRAVALDRQGDRKALGDLCPNCLDEPGHCGTINEGGQE